MKVLMYGWEFPPRISGGLGIACYAIVKELAKQNVNVTLVLPEVVVDQINNANVSLVGCEGITDLGSNVTLDRAAIMTFLNPYLKDSDYQKLLGSNHADNLFDVLNKIHLPEQLKNLIDLARRSDLLATYAARYGKSLLAEVLRYAIAAGPLAAKHSHDVIHAHDWLTILAALEGKRVSHKPVIFHIHALETDRSGDNIDQRIYAIEKYGMQQADHIVAVSQYTKNKIIENYGIAAAKISVVHNGTDFETVSKRSGDPNRPKMVLFLGRVTNQKGPYFFVEIARKILAERQDVHFVIAGVGDQLRDMINRVAAYRLGTKIHFTGFLERDQVKKLYQLADVYVMPSVSEPFGISCLEALSQGVPAVISKQSGVAEVLKHTLVADYWDVDEMASKILALLQYQALHQTSAESSKQDLRNLSWGKTANLLINLYHQLKKQR